MQSIIRKMKSIETLILANAMVFILILALPGPIFGLFALQPISVLAKPWTIVTNMFLHAGFEHILFNMIALFFFGIYLERIIGTKEFMKVYFIGGIFASLSYVFTSFVFNIPPPNVPAVGASGAIFAVMGALVVLRPKITIFVNFFFPMPLYIWAILYTLYSLPAMFIISGNIAYNAHLGGLIAGLIFGYYYKKKFPENPYAHYGPRGYYY